MIRNRYDDFNPNHYSFPRRDPNPGPFYVKPTRENLALTMIGAAIALALLVFAVHATAAPLALPAPWQVPTNTIILPPSAALPRVMPTPPVCLACKPGQPGHVPGPCAGFNCAPQPRITPPWLIGPLPPTVTR
jgi:hypothetical protein